MPLPTKYLPFFLFEVADFSLHFQCPCRKLRSLQMIWLSIWIRCRLPDLTCPLFSSVTGPPPTSHHRDYFPHNQSSTSHRSWVYDTCQCPTLPHPRRSLLATCSFHPPLPLQQLPCHPALCLFSFCVGCQILLQHPIHHHLVYHCLANPPRKPHLPPFSFSFCSWKALHHIQLHPYTFWISSFWFLALWHGPPSSPSNKYNKMYHDCQDPPPNSWKFHTLCTSTWTSWAPRRSAPCLYPPSVACVSQHVLGGPSTASS
mmetsp:Transcript_88858/g.176706  ORF Transcript_88858/g.176706 Transcript_88858/m.176706 type:complete len:258 (-) Transcript_88858:481-1254(-)